MRRFNDFGTPTTVLHKPWQGRELQVYVNEFWTAKQRAAHSLHEVSYRACFKPQLPRFFIERFTAPGEKVYDPFMGRGTTLLESAFLDRIPVGCDVNPLSFACRDCTRSI
jgi:DNA modification methylase